MSVLAHTDDVILSVNCRLILHHRTGSVKEILESSDGLHAELLAVIDKIVRRSVLCGQPRCRNGREIILHHIIHIAVAGNPGNGSGRRILPHRAGKAHGAAVIGHPMIPGSHTKLGRKPVLIAVYHRLIPCRIYHRAERVHNCQLLCL